MTPRDNGDDAIAAAPRKICLACGADGVKNRCGGCRRVYFCDRECQKRIWTQHRPDCQPVSVPVTMQQPSSPTSTSYSAADVVRETPPSSNAGMNQEPPPPVSSAGMNQEPPPSPSASTSKEQKQNEQVQEEPSNEPSATTPKKKNKHKKKRTKRSHSVHAPPSERMATVASRRSASLCGSKHVMWGCVRAREFTRFPGGGGAVPYDGTWALGLGKPLGDVELGTVAEVEELRDQELAARVKSLTKAKRGHVREGETRQFDYVSGPRNPLFGRLSERERKQVLLSESTPIADAEVESHSKTLRRKRSVSSEAPEDPDVPATPDLACVSIEQLDEFAQIRESREVSCGCSCGDLVKKVAKMNVKKLHAFLAERGIEPAVHSKPELMALAKGIAAQEKNCSNQKDCECARNGIECHASVCTGCAGDCHNPHKAYSYRKQEVTAYRKMQIAKWREAQPTGVSVA
ncbi:hypothetical protein PINS_up011997 [Pythium insidiosum]|nr:hypothetical protein PINS_up011997 [Pythium insidiosum]